METEKEKSGRQVQNRLIIKNDLFQHMLKEKIVGVRTHLSLCFHYCLISGYIACPNLYFPFRRNDDFFFREGDASGFVFFYSLY